MVHNLSVSVNDTSRLAELNYVERSSNSRLCSYKLDALTTKPPLNKQSSTHTHGFYFTLTANAKDANRLCRIN